MTDKKVIEAWAILNGDGDLVADTEQRSRPFVYFRGGDAVDAVRLSGNSDLDVRPIQIVIPEEKT